MAIDPTASSPLVPIRPNQDRLPSAGGDGTRVEDRTRGPRPSATQATPLQTDTASPGPRTAAGETRSVQLQEIPTNAPRGSILDIVV